MSVQQFCLRWNNHQPNFISVCSSLLHNGTLVDVTLAAEGRQLQAHKIVLSACSSYFQTLFTTNPCQHPIVILKDVQYNDLKTMVDFMYYGEVNVSQEQLPHILKTAEMLKIKGLAEMPEAATSLTKSESKSSTDQTEQIQGPGSGSDSIWGSTESQFQHHHMHHQSQQQQQQQHQQQQQQQQQQQSHQLAQHQQRRTPSPNGAGISPATRRKRLRKSSTSGSTEQTSEEQSSIEGATNINISQMNQMSFGGASTNLTQNIHTKIIKESSSTDTDTHPQDSSQESIDDSSVHHHIQHIKPESELGNVQQSIPLDISGPTTPSEQDAPSASCPQSQSSHSEKITQQSITAGIGSKRNRFLIRQPRIKRESDTPSQQSPEVVESEPVYSRSLLTVPPKIERHASEPAPSITPSSPHLLSIPQSSPYLVKQHSHPLLPSQSPPISPPSMSSGFSLHRQLSYPVPSSSSLKQTLAEPLPSSSTNILSTSTLTHASSMVQFVSTPVKQEIEIAHSSKSGSQSPSVILISDPLTATSTSEHIPTIRVKSEELHRSSSSPQATRELSLENPRASHCPVIRPGPALGCNFCWNTIDAHGRILRRKTKYHCPECQTNLCIVPCFQEYHERQANDGQSNNESTLLSSSGKNASSSSLRHYPKTGSI